MGDNHLITDAENIKREKVVLELLEMFGSILDKEIIESVAWNHNYNLQLASSSLKELSCNPDSKETGQQENAIEMDRLYNQPMDVIMNVPERKPLHNNSPSISTEPSTLNKSKKEKNVDMVVDLIHRGFKVLVLLRGIPGSGKSYLGKSIIQSVLPMANLEEHLLSADDYFMKGGKYLYDPHKIADAHAWNQRRAAEAMHRGVSPVIIDNTHIELWEMKPYAVVGASCGYVIEVLEPHTHWAFNPHELYRRNIHGVPKKKIESMILRFEKNVTPGKLISAFNIKYAAQPIPKKNQAAKPSEPNYAILSKMDNEISNFYKEINELDKNIDPMDIVNETKSNSDEAWGFDDRAYYSMRNSNSNTNIQKDKIPCTTTHDTPNIYGDGNNYLVHPNLGIENYLPEGESTKINPQSITLATERLIDIDNEDNLSQVTPILILNENEQIERTPVQHMEVCNKNEQAVTELQNCFPSIPSDTVRRILQKCAYNTERAAELLLDEKSYKSMSVEASLPSLSCNLQDQDHYSSKRSTNTSSFPVLDLNAWGLTDKALVSWDDPPFSQFLESSFENKLPTTTEKSCLTVDNSTLTESSDFMDSTGRKTIISKQFVPVDIRLDRKPMSKLTLDKSSMTDEDLNADFKYDESFRELQKLFPAVPSEILKDIFEKCNYNIDWAAELLLDDKREIFTIPSKTAEEYSQEVNEKSNTFATLSSPHAIEEVFTHRTVSVDDEFSDNIHLRNHNSVDSPSTSKTSIDTSMSLHNNSLKNKMEDSGEESDSYDSDRSESDEFMQLNMGDSVVSQLEAKFGHPNLTYPQGLQPVIQVPVALARQLHAFYLESVFHQIDAQNHVLQTINKEDEEFASKLQAQEYEYSIRFPSPAVPDIRQIMQEQVESSRNSRQINKWKNLTPDDLAYKLTKQKLFETFPKLEKELLEELLHAHGNCYVETVTSIVASGEKVTDSTYVRDPPISKAGIEEMKSAQEKSNQLNSSELQNGSAAEYRAEANKILELRTELYQKAQQYYQRGMQEVAMFYSNLAREQTQKYEYANTLAAQSFLAEQNRLVNNSETLDLHYLKSKEALTSLDIFLDREITKLKDSNQNHKQLFIITGRGKRSKDGRSILRPVVTDRLNKRQIKNSLMNPGLLKLEIWKTSKVTNDL